MTIKTVILCGGQGTRIRDVADDIPKPMILIGDRPIVWHIMNLYASYGFSSFVLCLGYKGWLLKEFFLNYHALLSDITVTLGGSTPIEFHQRPDRSTESWTITLAETGRSTQTGGRIWQARRYLADCDLFCVTYGDGIADLDITELVAFHRSHGRVGTVTGVRPPGRFGVMTTGASEALPVVHAFAEKPQTDQGWINGGFFVFDQRLWSYMSDDPNLIFEKEPLAALAKDDQLVMYEHTGFWQPMDTYREWKILNDIWAGGNAPWSR